MVSNHKIVIFTSLSPSQDQGEERSRENDDAKKPCAHVLGERMSSQHGLLALKQKWSLEMPKAEGSPWN